MGKKKNTKIIYFTGIALLLPIFFFIIEGVNAQTKDKSEIVLTAQCIPDKQFVAPQRIALEFGIDTIGNKIIPSVTALVTGGPTNMPVGARVLKTGWTSKDETVAIAFIEGPKMYYRTTCNPSMTTGRSVKLVGFGAKDNEISSIWVKQGVDSKGELSAFSKFSGKGPADEITISEAKMENDGTEATFGEGGKSGYTIGVTMDMNLIGDMTTENTIKIGVKDN